MELEQCINFVLTKAQQKVHQFFKGELAAHGVTPGQYAVLKCLWDSSGLTLKQIAERVSLDSSTVTGLLDRLEQKGMIIKQVDPNDRRALKVILTDKGRSLEEPINTCIESCNRKVMELLKEGDREAFKDLLEQVDSQVDSIERN